MPWSRRTPFSTGRLFIITWLFAIVIGLIICLGSRPDEPPASIAFLGYTNDSTGARLATFAVTNLESFVVRRQAGYWIDLKVATGQTNHASRWFSNATDLNPRASEIVAVPVPTNQIPWRVVLLIRSDLDRLSQMIDNVRLISPVRL